jgi:hypothetical protein
MIGFDWEALWFGVALVAVGLVALGAALVRSAR